MNLHNELLTQVRKTWELIRPAAPVHRPMRSADQLVKLNLPPLLGRRDAAYDHAGWLIDDQELFARDEIWRQKHYETISGLLEIAADDTCSILLTLSSPDTALRERRIRDLIELLRNMVRGLGNFTRLSDAVLNVENPTLKHFGIRYTDTERLRGEQVLSEVEISTVNQLRLFCTHTQPKIQRYREYTAKSFSKPYASRYRKAYDSYSKIFSEAVRER